MKYKIPIITRKTTQRKRRIRRNNEKKAFLPTVKTLSTGKYTVGTDIAAELYNLEVESGIGFLTGDLKNRKQIFIRDSGNHGRI